MFEYDAKIDPKPENIHEDIFNICLQLTKSNVCLLYTSDAADE